MKYITLTLALIGTLAFSGLLVGCEEEGPAERMGESMDEAGDEIRDGIEDATN